MNRALSIATRGALGSALSVATFGYFGYTTEEIIGTPYIVLADVSIRLLALYDVSMRSVASSDQSIRLTTDVADVEL